MTKRRQTYHNIAFQVISPHQALGEAAVMSQPARISTPAVVGAQFTTKNRHFGMSGFLLRDCAISNHWID